MKETEAYINNIIELEKNILTDELGNLEACSVLFADTLAKGANIFLFGTGHSHMLAEELFYRAGGLVNIRPILETSLMLHESASKSTKIERLGGYAQILFEQYGLKKDDAIVIISNSGRNGVCVDMAQLCAENGLHVVALTNLRHSKSSTSRHSSGKKLYEFAEIILDNHGCIGDASVEIEGFPLKVAPTSTAIGAMLLNAIEARTVRLLLDRGITPEVYSSSNVDGGDLINDRYIEKYSGIIRSL